MFKTLTISLVILGMAAVSQAAIFAVEMQPSGGTPVSQAGMEIWAAAPSGTTPISFTTLGGETITLTPSADALEPNHTISLTATDKKTDADYTDGAPREHALQDYFRLQPSPWADPNDVVKIEVEIAGVAANTLHGIRIGNMNPYRNVYVMARPTGGTIGQVVHHVATNPPALSPTDTNDKSYVLSYTSDGTGKLTFDLVWDKAAWMLDPNLYPLYPENEVEIGYIELVPEPATLSLLALGGLLAIRRRR